MNFPVYGRTDEEISSQSVCLPIFPEMTEEQIQYVIDAVNTFYK